MVSQSPFVFLASKQWNFFRKGLKIRNIDCILFRSRHRFGEDAAQDMVEWAEEHFPQSDGRILDGSFQSPLNNSPSSRTTHDQTALADLIASLSLSTVVGTGNGQLMFCFSKAGYTHLTGVDYSQASIELAKSILASRTAPKSKDSDDDVEDEEEEARQLRTNPPTFFVADILEVALARPVQGVTDERWDLITDKGTYDAVCLSDETKEGKKLQELYVESIAKLLPKGGIFLITSCKSISSDAARASSELYETNEGLISLYNDRQLDTSGTRESLHQRSDRYVSFRRIERSLYRPDDALNS